MYNVKKQFIVSKRKVYSMKSIKYVAQPLWASSFIQSVKLWLKKVIGDSKLIEVDISFNL